MGCSNMEFLKRGKHLWCLVMMTCICHWQGWWSFGLDCCGLCAWYIAIAWSIVTHSSLLFKNRLVLSLIGVYHEKSDVATESCNYPLLMSCCGFHVVFQQLLRWDIILRCNILFGLIGHFGFLKDVKICFYLSRLRDLSILDRPMLEIFRRQKLYYEPKTRFFILFLCYLLLYLLIYFILICSQRRDNIEDVISCLFL